MCTFFLFIIISKLANGLTMGNKTNGMKTDSDPTSLDCTNPPKTVDSEEDYLPMPRSMREILLNNRKLHRIMPERDSSNDCKTEVEDNPPKECEEIAAENVKSYEVHNLTTNEQNFEKLDVKIYNDIPQSENHNVIPIVTILKPIEVDEKTKSLPNTQVGQNGVPPVFSQLYPNSRNTATNRQYSLVDIRTGLTKSKFTLDLEEKLRRSKRVLGFDTNFKGWKEFSYTDGGLKEEHRIKNSGLNGVKLNEKENKDISKGVGGSTDCSTQNYQILGLCSVGRAHVFQNQMEIEPVKFGSDVMIGDAINELAKTHNKKEACPCDLCTLAFLTDMNCHSGGTTNAYHKSKHSLSNSDRVHKAYKEKIRVIDNIYGNKSIEISVKSCSPRSRYSLFSTRSDDTAETKPDCTNTRIRNKFKQHEMLDVREVYNNQNSTRDEKPYSDKTCNENTCDDIAIELFSPKQRSRPTSPSPRLFKRSASLTEEAFKNKYRKISPPSTAPSASSSSSLSTVLSYKRVRQIFQTIIEGRRVKKNTRRDVLKFKEMEDLGLGKLMNNRWYPSEHKTFSIWKDMNENSLLGLQGEFKKCKKGINKAN